MAKKVKGTVGVGFRNQVKAKTPPLPKGKEAKDKEKARRKELAKGPAMTAQELQQRQFFRTRSVVSGKSRGTRAAARAKAVQDSQ